MPKAGTAKLVRTFKHTAKVLTAKIGDFDRPMTPFLARVARAVVKDAEKHARVPRQSARPDQAAIGKAAAAFESEFAKWEELIDSIRGDRSLSVDQRASGVVALRIRQQIAAAGARDKVMQEEKQKAKAAARAARALMAKPRKH